MPGATLPNMSIVLPALGGDSGDWDTYLNEALGVIDEHDHTSGAGLAITTAALDIDDDLSIGGHGLTGVGQVAFTAVAALASGSKVLFVDSSTNELYWRTNAGTNVKLTSGTSINTSLVGGIVGDYTSVGAEVAYDDANDRYTFKQEGSPKPWARIASGDVRIYEYNTTETVYVGLKAPAALGASFDITFPTAAPGSTAIVQMDSSGNLTVSNTVANAATFSTSITTPTIAGTPNFTGAVTMASTLGVTGLITATAGLTAAADQHVTVSGTGEYKHGSRSLFQTPESSVVPTGTYSGGASSDLVSWTLSTGGGTVYIPLRGLIDGDRLLSVVIEGAATQEPTFTIYSNQGGSDVERTHTASLTIVSNSSTTLTLDTPLEVNKLGVLGMNVFVKVVTGASTFAIRQVVVTIDHP